MGTSLYISQLPSSLEDALFFSIEDCIFLAGDASAREEQSCLAGEGPLPWAASQSTVS